MAITTAIPAGTKTHLFKGALTWDAAASNFIGLFTSTVSGTYNNAVSEANATYTYIATTNSDEASVGGGGTGYTAKGLALTEAAPAESSNTSYLDFTNDPQWTLSGASATLASDGAFIFDEASVTDLVWSYHSYSTATASGDGATFTLQAPAAAAGTAIIEIA